MTPCIQWYTNGELTDVEFGSHLSLWKQLRERLGVSRYDPDAECVYVPIADADRIIDLLDG